MLPLPAASEAVRMSLLWWLVTLLAAVTVAEDSLDRRHGQVMYVKAGKRPLHRPHSDNGDIEFSLVTNNEHVPEFPSSFPDIGADEGGDVILVSDDPAEDVELVPGGDVADIQPPSIECGREIDGTQARNNNGSFSSPGYPDNYPAFLSCRWRITATPGKKILATFTEFDVTASTDCRSDYVVVTTGEVAKGGSSRRYCGKAAPREIESVGEFLSNWPFLIGPF